LHLESNGRATGKPDLCGTPILAKLKLPQLPVLQTAQGKTQQPDRQVYPAKLAANQTVQQGLAELEFNPGLQQTHTPIIQHTLKKRDAAALSTIAAVSENATGCAENTPAQAMKCSASGSQRAQTALD
jgi:hypothetical protein